MAKAGWKAADHRAIRALADALERALRANDSREWAPQARAALTTNSVAIQRAVAAGVAL